MNKTIVDKLAPSQKAILKLLAKNGFDISWNEYKDIKGHFNNYGISIDIKPRKGVDNQFWAWDYAITHIFKCSITQAIKYYLDTPSNLYFKAKERNWILETNI